MYTMYPYHDYIIFFYVKKVRLTLYNNNHNNDDDYNVGNKQLKYEEDEKLTKSSQCECLYISM